MTTTATSNNLFDFDNLSTIAVQGSIWFVVNHQLLPSPLTPLPSSGHCYVSQDPEIQAGLQAQRTLAFLADDFPIFTRARGLTVAESEQRSETRMAGILQAFDADFEHAAR